MSIFVLYFDFILSFIFLSLFTTFKDQLVSDQSKTTTGSQLICSVNVAEFRSLVKTLVGGVKTITWGFFNSKV